MVHLLDERGKRHQVTLDGGMVKVTGLGLVDTGRMVGMPDGSRLEIANHRFVMLRPGVYEHMISLDRGAQIIIPKDAAEIVLRTSLSAGDVVIESGVGSGALAMALLNAVSPGGRVISVEMREDFAKRAGRNIARLGLDGWECVIGDACDVQLDVTADAVILDMPVPWAAISNLDRNLRPGGRVCAYTPNINQLEATVIALRDMGYVDVCSIETLQREMEVHAGGVRPSFDMLGHTGYLTFGRKTVVP